MAIGCNVLINIMGLVGFDKDQSAFYYRTDKQVRSIRHCCCGSTDNNARGDERA